MRQGRESAFTRRRFIATGIGLATTLQLQRAAHAMGLDAQAEVCKLAAEQEVGPYYVADELLRADVSEGKPGVPRRSISGTATRLGCTRDSPCRTPWVPVGQADRIVEAVLAGRPPMARRQASTCNAEIGPGRLTGGREWVVRRRTIPPTS